MAERINAARGEYFPALTALRGIAAIWVTFFHIWQYAGSPPLAVGILDMSAWLMCGGFGVDLFFVLSGFLVSRPFLRKLPEKKRHPQDLSSFWIHRFKRILPAYYTQLIILIIFNLVNNNSLPSIQSLISHIFLISNLFPGSVSLLNPVFWTLPVEWDFYLVLPLLIITFNRLKGWWMLLLVLIWVVFLRWYLHQLWQTDTIAAQYWYPWIVGLPARLDQFVCGMTACWILDRYITWHKYADFALISGLILIGIEMCLIAQYGDIYAKAITPWIFFHHSILAIGFGLIIYGSTSNSRIVSMLFHWRFLHFVGMISFSLYLWHYPLLQWWQKWPLTAELQKGPLWLALGAQIPPIILISWLSYWVIERPFLGRNSV